MYHEKTALAARGKWRGILLVLGVPEKSLSGKHGPCPICGGRDRFRFDNLERRGTWICSVCGAGDGLQLALAVTGRSFKDLAGEIDVMLGNIKTDGPVKAMLSEDDRRRALVGVWAATSPVVPGDLVHRYLASRGLDEVVYPKALRFGQCLPDGECGVRPCMVALVGRHGEAKFDTMHRTFLKPDGSGKAEMEAPRKLMPGELQAGACVALSEWGGSGSLGIAEGIETALSASALFDMPVWAAVNANMLAKWWPPEGCEEVAVFIDHDKNFTGHAAGYRLANRLAMRGVPVTVHCPDPAGSDWNDVLMRRASLRGNAVLR